MSSIQNIYSAVVLSILLLVGQSQATTLTSEDAANLMAARLVQEQIVDGNDQGLWTPELQFMGPITAGMVSAYEWTGDSVFHSSAELAGSYVLNAGAGVGSLWGDEVYALTRLSEVSDDRDENMWLIVAQDFFGGRWNEADQSTAEKYIPLFDEVEPSTAVFYLAHYAIAANCLDDDDKEIWRQAAVQYLSRVDDTSNFPVMALGVATWALAITGPLDTTPITGDEKASPYWQGMTLSDLPTLLRDQQVPEEKPFGGSFYWRFDHATGDPEGGLAAGYTEDTAFAVLGLVAAASQDPNFPGVETDLAVDRAKESLLTGIDQEGRVYAHVSLQGPTYNVFAGEVLQALWSIEQYQHRRNDADREVPGDQ